MTSFGGEKICQYQTINKMVNCKVNNLIYFKSIVYMINKTHLCIKKKENILPIQNF